MHPMVDPAHHHGHITPATPSPNPVGPHSNNGAVNDYCHCDSAYSCCHYYSEYICYNNCNMPSCCPTEHNPSYLSIASSTCMDTNVSLCCSLCCYPTIENDYCESCICSLCEDALSLSTDDSGSVTVRNVTGHAKQELRRKHAVEELLQTERDYVKDLGYLVEVFFAILAAQDWVLDEHMATISRNADELLAFHRQFLQSLEDAVATDPDSNCLSIAEAFLDLGADFMLYLPYCDLHGEAWALCEKYRDRPEWSAFTKECSTLITKRRATSSTINTSSTLDNTPSSPSPFTSSVQRLQFEDYLIKPVQRVCRYELLLREILRYTDSDTQGTSELTAALDLMRSVVSEIDTVKYERDIKERTDRFVQRLDGDWRIKRDLVANLGDLVIGGALDVTYTYLGQNMTKPRYLGCFVFPSYMILVRPKKVTVYEPKHWFPLRQAELHEDCDDECNFVIRCKKHTFSFSASCNQEKQLWIKRLREAMEAQQSPQAEMIVPSLSGVTATLAKRPSVRLSRSFTTILDMRVRSSAIEKEDEDDEELPQSELTRSMSTCISPPPASPPALKKRYSADYPAIASPTAEPRKRPGSLDLLSGNSNMIGKIRSSHQNALRMAVDHRIQDVCSLDYLSARTTHIRLNLGKRKSAPFIHSPASSVSQLSPRLTSVAEDHVSRSPPPLDMQSSVGSTRSKSRGLDDEMDCPTVAGTEQPTSDFGGRATSRWSTAGSSLETKSMLMDRMFNKIAVPFQRKRSEQSKLFRWKRKTTLREKA
ncbi:hypothetical protein BCR43DRAFT_146463 [Syncephalastrum racemosum]|uniref:DH domain-containing protein n=1 Tax=Syncephalastrum racemosum TaxID=13706 RepID=A0A1X2HMG3_SYNRA|nr:hypothetical protein BCR43DRAFT_146463 [Syncephalastrum racemosum]